MVLEGAPTVGPSAYYTLALFLLGHQLRKHDVALADTDETDLRWLILWTYAFLPDTEGLPDADDLHVIHLEIAQLVHIQLIGESLEVVDNLWLDFQFEKVLVFLHLLIKHQSHGPPIHLLALFFAHSER